MKPYKAQCGDIIWLSLNPQAGHETSGHRPAIVVSNNTFNRLGSAAIVCPITNTNRSLPFQLKLDSRTKTTGVIMCDQAKSLDLKAREASFIEKAPEDIIAEVMDIVIGFVEAD